MPDYDLRHLDISSLRTSENYKSRNTGPRKSHNRQRDRHGPRLLDELNHAFGVADERRPTSEDLPDDAPAPDGSYVVVELLAKTTVERKKEDTREGTQQLLTNGHRQVVLHVPDAKRDVLREVLNDYANGPLTDTGNPSKAGRAEPIEAFRHAELLDLWRDRPEAMPSDPQETIWWGVWCWPDRVDDVRDLAERLEAVVAPEDRWITFPEAIVLPIHGRRAEIELMIYGGRGGIAELSLIKDNPAIVMEEYGELHDDLVEDLAARTTWPSQDAPAVCVLDTGANRGHPLLEPALSPGDQQSIDPAWGVDDHHRTGHGSGMAGLSLHGDLTSIIGDRARPVLTHRLETVKILPPGNFPDNEPSNYGAIMRSATALAEIQNPSRARILCSAVTNQDRSGDRPTSWSASIDRLASGADEVTEEEQPRRLYVQAVGNIPPAQSWAQISDPDLFPGEDPGQAWNALTVGGVTFLNDIQDRGYADWKSAADVGEVSPYARNSIAWPDGSAPVKPDVVFEAGNRALNDGEPVMDGLPSLSVLTTGKGGASGPLSPFWATSASTAQASRMAARLTAANPDYWPETVRALIAHSARWTPPMQNLLNSAPGLTERKALRRRFGYGVPDIARALQSASNDLALVAQAHIQPFRKDGGSIRFSEAHYYDLPWPRDILEQLENTTVRLKVALSYFVEPNPTSAATIDPARYRSFGLRFDLKRSLETPERFFARTNAELGTTGKSTDPNDKWLFGPKAVAAGSLHVDVWEGPAVELAARDKICIFPVTGWWRERTGLKMHDRKARYALVLGIEAPGVDVDLYAHVEQVLELQTAVEIEVE